jgi:5-carboxymethyl-2-hydroxymuconate isomerase
MPHIKLEYTENVQWKNPIQDIFPKLQTVLIQHARVQPENCKSRAMELKDFHCTGKSRPGGFIHLGISLLSGRTEEVKTNIGKECSRIIQSFIENIAEIQVSVELRDMDRNGYFTTNQL